MRDRYEISVLIGPCSDADAEVLMEEIANLRTCERVAGCVGSTRLEADEDYATPVPVQAELAELRAAVSRLTEALEEIADGFDGDEFQDSADACERHIAIARAALSPTPPHPDFSDDPQAHLQGLGADVVRNEPPRCYCGYLGWTVEKWGRVTHKRGCPARTDPWHQGDPYAAAAGYEPETPAP